MSQQEIRLAVREQYPRIDKYSLTAICQRIERGIAMGIIITIAYIQNVASAFVRHNRTDYDSRLAGHKFSTSRAQARYDLQPVISNKLSQWKG